MTKELEIVETAARNLMYHGDVYVGYVTAGLEPYSAQQKPDLFFVPSHGPHAQKEFCVEVRLFDGRTIPLSYIRALGEHRAFVVEDADCALAGFAFATDATLDADAVAELKRQGIELLSGIANGELLTEETLAWTHGRQGLDQTRY